MHLGDMLTVLCGRYRIAGELNEQDRVPQKATGLNPEQT